MRTCRFLPVFTGISRFIGTTPPRTDCPMTGAKFSFSASSQRSASVVNNFEATARPAVRRWPTLSLVYIVEINCYPTRNDLTMASWVAVLTHFNGCAHKQHKSSTQQEERVANNAMMKLGKIWIVSLSVLSCRQDVPSQLGSLTRGGLQGPGVGKRTSQRFYCWDLLSIL